MKNTKVEPIQIAQKEWLDVDELEREYGFKKDTQKNWRSQKKIPYSKIGGVVRYSRTKINEWLNYHSIEATG